MLFFIYCTEWFHQWLSESWRSGWHCQSHRSDHRGRRVMGSGEEKTFGTLCNSFFFENNLICQRWSTPQTGIHKTTSLSSPTCRAGDQNGSKTNSWGQIDTFIQSPRSWVAWEPSWRNQDVRPGLENFTIRREMIPGCVCGFSPRPTPALQSNTLAWPLQARVWRWSMRNVISDCSLIPRSKVPHQPACTCQCAEKGNQPWGLFPNLPNFPRRQYFPQVDSYSAFYDNTGKEGAGSTGLADQIAGTTEVLQWMFFWQKNR